MKLDGSKIKNILVITLSNIGDVILTFPVMDICKQKFQESDLTVVTSQKSESLFKGNPHIKKVIVFDKHLPGLKQLQWILNLRKEKYDLTVDLRNTAIPLLIRTRCRTPLFRKKLTQEHKRWEHLERIKNLIEGPLASDRRFCLSVDDQDKSYVDAFIKKMNTQHIIVVAPSAADRLKRWAPEGFASVCDRLIEKFTARIVFVGDKNDHEMIQNVKENMNHPAVDLSGQTTLTQLAYLLKCSSLALVNDSAVMHMASYLNTPVVAIFGPTDPKLYGPWSDQKAVIHDSLITRISVEEVYLQVEKFMEKNK